MSKTIKTWYTPNQAIEILKKADIKVTRATLLGQPDVTKGWVKQYNLGHKVGGIWVIFRDRLEKFMKDKFNIGKVYEKKRKKTSNR